MFFLLSHIVVSGRKSLDTHAFDNVFATGKSNFVLKTNDLDAFTFSAGELTYVYTERVCWNNNK